MKIVKKITENCHFYSSEKSLFVARECFRNVIFILIMEFYNKLACLESNA